MFTRSHTKPQNWISSLYIILLLAIPRPIHKITRKFVFQVVPEPKLRCSRLKSEAFQFCSQGVPEVFQKLFQERKIAPKLQVGKGAGHPTPSPLERSTPY